MRGAAFSAVLLLASASPALAAPCDRACLRADLDRYLSAVVRHDPHAARLAPSYRGTENAVAVKAGSGLWSSTLALGKFERRYFDPVTGQTAYYGLIDEAAGPAVIAVRVRFVDNKAVESEAVIARKGDRLFDPEGMIRNAPADQPSRAPRAVLQATANGLLDAMQNHDAAGVPHTADCVRIESGTGGKLATGETRGHCAAGFDHLLQISAVGHRRYPLIDEEAGVVLGVAMFLRPPGAVMPTGQPWKRNVIMNIFTTRSGVLSGVYGTTHYLEAAEPESTGWPD